METRPQRRRSAGRFPAGLVAVLLLGSLGAGLAGCLSGAPNPRDNAPRIAWPPPPAPARIEFVRAFRTPRDLGIRKNWLTRFFRYLGRGRQRTTLARPFGVAVADGGVIVISDPDNRCVHILDPQRSRYRRLQMAAGAPLESPIGVAVDGDGRIYVTDSRRRGIFRYDPDGEWLDTLGAEGDLDRPTGLALDIDRGVLHVVDTLGHRVVTYDLEGERIGAFGRRGTAVGEFNYPVAAAVDRQGRIFVTDSMNFRVQIFAPTGEALGSFGRAGDGPGEFDKAKGIAVDSFGHIYVVEGLHDVIHVYDQEGRLLTVIGGTGAGPGQFWLPAGIHIDRRGRILVADSANHRVQILQILGTPEPGGSG